MKAEITFLGTSSAVPTEKRNHTAILISWSNEKLLVDCGEGTQRQFKIAKQNPCKLTKLLITHWHGDHVFGIPGLFQTLEMSEYKKTLNIYGPRGIAEKFSLLEKIYGKLHISKKIQESKSKVFENKDYSITAMEMTHTTPTLGYTINFKEKRRLDKQKIKKLKLPNSPLLGKLQQGKDIVFKGRKIKAKDVSYIQQGKKIAIILDTSYNKNAVKLAKNADILICESSFPPGDEKKAEEYKHMTAKQATLIAKQAKVKQLILTHISQRDDPQIENILKEIKKTFRNTTVAEDLSKFTLEI